MSRISNMPPKKIYSDLPENLTFEKSRGLFRYRNKITGKRQWIGSDKDEAVKLAEAANQALNLIRQKKSLVPTVDDIITEMLDSWIYEQAWSDSYRKTQIFRLKAIRNKWGSLTFDQLKRGDMKAWIKTRSDRGQTFNKWRGLLELVWSYAIEQGLTNINEASAIMPMSTSKKLKANQKRRKRLTTEAFWAIHDHPDTPLYLQIAMEQSLVTLQSLQQMSNTKFTDYKDDGFLYYIRNKTAADSEMAFIKIAITSEIEAIRKKALEDNIVSPYLVRKKPLRRDRDKLEKKPHWTYIWPERLGEAFRDAREATGIFKGWSTEEKPAFHEIRSLGGRLYEQLGYEKNDIQELMTHTDLKTTEIYLSDPTKLKPEHFHKVKAELTLSQARKIDL